MARRWDWTHVRVESKWDSKAGENMTLVRALERLDEEGWDIMWVVQGDAGTGWQVVARRRRRDSR